MLYKGPQQQGANQTSRDNWRAVRCTQPPLFRSRQQYITHRYYQYYEHVLLLLIRATSTTTLRTIITTWYIVLYQYHIR